MLLMTVGAGDVAKLGCGDADADGPAESDRLAAVAGGGGCSDIAPAVYISWSLPTTGVFFLLLCFAFVPRFHGDSLLPR